jgi:hypothetical protein
MALTSTEHARVQRQTREQRNASARTRRAALAQRRADATVYAVQEDDGTELLLVVLAREPDRAQVLRRDPATGAWVCGCFSARWSAARSCLHAAAANGKIDDGR